MKKFATAVAILLTGACSQLLEPSGPLNRKDPGTVVVRVVDASGAPVANVWVYIELPNSVGSTFWEGSPTRADGTVTHYVIPAGRRTVEIRTPPDGFTVVNGPRQEVDVVKDRTVSVVFTLQRT
jgi:hypothetical protein